MPAWKLYTNTKDALGAIIDEIDKAQESIDIECFYLEPDATGKIFTDALLNAKDRGVKVRLLVDSMGSINFTGQYLQYLLGAEVEVEFFNWINPWSQKNLKIWYFRDHRRTFVFDKKIAFTGGICIGDITLNWRDTTVRFEGKVVEQALQAFEWMWLHCRKRNMRRHPEPQFTVDSMMYSTQSPLPRQRYLYYQIVRGIRNAKREIFITTPYFLPDYRIVRTMRRARRRGVVIIIIIPKASDHPIVDIGAQSYFEQLLKYGIRIFRYSKMIHTKTMVIDPKTTEPWALIGSMNMDNISFRYNFEAGLVTTDSSLIQELQENFIEDLLDCEQLDKKVWKKRGFIQEMKESLVWLIRKLL